MFNDAPTSPISKKDQILAALASAKKLIFPKQLHEATGIEKYELGNLLRELRTEGLVLLLENGVYTLTEAGIEKARAEKMQIHPTAKTRAERYKRAAGNVMASPVTTAKQLTEPKKPSRQVNKAKTPAKQVKVTNEAKSPAQAQPGTIAELFNTSELTDKGATLLFRLLKTLKLEDLQQAGFSNEEVYEFGDVYRFIKDRVEVTEAIQ
jgi:DNA-binding MarR family transcriptional regulator